MLNERMYEDKKAQIWELFAFEEMAPHEIDAMVGLPPGGAREAILRIWKTDKAEFLASVARRRRSGE